MVCPRWISKLDVARRSLEMAIVVRRHPVNAVVSKLILPRQLRFVFRPLRRIELIGSVVVTKTSQTGSVAEFSIVSTICDGDRFHARVDCGTEQGSGSIQVTFIVGTPNLLREGFTYKIRRAGRILHLPFGDTSLSFILENP